MSTGELELPWAVAGVDDEGVQLSLIYEGSPGVRAQRALILQSEESVRLTLLTTDRVGRTSIQYVGATVELPVPLAGRPVLGEDPGLARSVAAAPFTGMDFHPVPVRNSRT